MQGRVDDLDGAREPLIQLRHVQFLDARALRLVSLTHPMAGFGWILTTSSCRCYVLSLMVPFTMGSYRSRHFSTSMVSALGPGPSAR